MPRARASRSRSCPASPPASPRPAYAGIPVTQRGWRARSRSSPAASPARRDRARLAGARALPGHARLLHGRRARWPQIAAGLIAGGRAADEPAAVVERGTLPGQRTVRAHAARHRRGRRPPGCGAPAITVVGAGGRARRQLAWLDAAPAARPHGRRHARAGAGERARGAPARRSAPRSSRPPRSAIEPLEAELPDLAALRPRLHHVPERRAHGSSPACATRGRSPARDRRDRAGHRPGAARARDRGRHRPVALGGRGPGRGARGDPGARALIARAEEARDVLPDALRARGVEVDVLPLYRTVAEPLRRGPRRGARRRLRHVHLGLVGALPPRRRGTLSGPRLVSIGPATSAAMRELGFEPDVEAADHTPDGLVAALLADASGTVAG